MRNLLLSLLACLLFSSLSAEVSHQECSNCRTDCCFPAEDWCCPCPEVKGHVDVIWMRAYHDEWDVSKSKTEPGFRVELDYLVKAGYGLGLRYFEAKGFQPEVGTVYEIDTETFDAYFTDRFTLGCNWRGSLELGIRKADWDIRLTDNDKIRTFGLLAGVSLKRCLCPSLALYGTTRYSYQFGKDKGSTTPLRTDGTFAISETQVGLEYDKQFCCVKAKGRIFGETQFWNGVMDTNNHNFGMYGFGFSFGISY